MSTKKGVEVAKKVGVETGKSSAIVMTKLSIEKLVLNVGQKERLVYDLDHSRLALRVRRNAGGTYSHAWMYLYMHEGARRKMYLGSYPKVSIKEAHATAAQLSSEIDSGIDPVQVRFECSEFGVPKTFGELYERWFKESAKKKRAKSHSHVAQIFRDHVFYSQSVKTIQLASLKPHFIKSILDRIQAKGKYRTLVMTLQLLKQMFAWAEHLEFIDRNPARAFTDSDFVRIFSRERFLDRSEISSFIQGLHRAEVEPQFISAFMLILATANRSTETRLIKLKDVNLTARTISIPVENQKEVLGVVKKEHVVHLSEFALKHVKQLIELARGSEYLLTHLRYSEKRFKEPISKSTLMQQLARNDGISPHCKTSYLQLKGGRFTVHDLRRTAASHMQDLGVSYDVIDKCQNHEIPGKVRRTYMRAAMRLEMIEAWDRLGQFLEEIESEALAALSGEHPIKGAAEPA